MFAGEGCVVRIGEVPRKGELLADGRVSVISRRGEGGILKSANGKRKRRVGLSIGRVAVEPDLVIVHATGRFAEGEGVGAAAKGGGGADGRPLASGAVLDDGDLLS